MTDISITAANVIAGDNAVKESGLAGETVTAGQTLYQSSTTRRWLKADSNSATAEVRAPKAIALNGAAIGQPLVVLKSGDVTIGATLTAGVAYYQSDTPGGICPVADVGAGEYATVIGIAKSTTVLAVNFNSSGVAL